MNKNVWLLFACQALMNAVMSGQTIMASLVGYKLSGSALNTLPMAIQMIAVMCASLLAGYAFPRLGRRGGFWLGCAIMMCGSLTFALGIYTGNFPLYCLGAIPAGLGFGISQHLRFAAAEVADSHAKARAISLVLAGGVLAAIVGPEMVKRTNALIPDYVFLATYLYLPILPIITAILLSFVRCRRREKKVGVPVPFRTIFARPDFVTAVVSSLVGYGTMNLVMASTPLQMLLCGFGVAASADVIRAHSIAMFLPGFVTGRLIQRFGVHQMIMLGGLLTLGCVAVNCRAAVVRHLHGGAGAAGGGLELHVRRRHDAADHGLCAGGAGAGAGDPRLHRVRQRGLTAVTSGAVQATQGWDVLNLTVVPPVLIAFVVVGWHWMARSRAAAVA